MKKTTVLKLVLILVFFSFNCLTIKGQEKNFEWNKHAPWFANGVSNQVAYINFGKNRIWGYVEVTLTSGYNYQLATGKYTKRFSLGRNVGSGAFFHQESEVPVSFGPIATQWKLGEFEINTNGDLVLPIYHLVSTSNKLLINVRGISTVPVDTELFSIINPTTIENNQKKDIISFQNSLILKGNLGIGTTSPSAKLEVKSTNLGASSNGTFKISGSGSASLRMGTMNDYSWIQSHGSRPLYINELGNNVIFSKNSGNVGIGTTEPTAKLSVNGKIHTKEVRVDLNLSDWADFVFEDNYSLPTLKEVEIYIKEKGHLKDIPSAKEVEKNGIYLGEMDAKLLQKIEELTLYTIEQQKEIEELKRQNSRIKDLEILVQKLLKDKN